MNVTHNYYLTDAAAPPAAAPPAPVPVSLTAGPVRVMRVILGATYEILDPATDGTVAYAPGMTVKVLAPSNVANDLVLRVAFHANGAQFNTSVSAEYPLPRAVKPGTVQDADPVPFPKTPPHWVRSTTVSAPKVLTINGAAVTTISLLLMEAGETDVLATRNLTA